MNRFLFATVVSAISILGASLTQTASAAGASTVAALNFTFLDAPNTLYTYTGHNNLGAIQAAPSLIVGGFSPNAAPSVATAFSLQIQNQILSGTTAETFQTLNPSLNLTLYGVNDYGVMVGTFNPLSNVYHGMLLQQGQAPTLIDAPYTGSQATFLTGINNAGTIVGAWQTAGGTIQHGFTWKAGAFTQIPDYPGAGQTFPWAINDKGDIAGYVDDSAGATHGFLLHAGTFTLLDPPGSAYTIATGLNDGGDVVGIYCTTTAVCGGATPAINGFVLHNGAYTTVDVPGAPVTNPTGINNVGIVVGTYTENGTGFQHGFLVRP